MEGGRGEEGGRGKERQDKNIHCCKVGIRSIERCCLRTLSMALPNFEMAACTSLCSVEMPWHVSFTDFAHSFTAWQCWGDTTDPGRDGDLQML